MPISHRRTQMLFVMPAHSQKAAGCPITWLCYQLACNSRLHRLIYQTYNETLFVLFIYDTGSRPHFAAAAVWFGADGANAARQRTNVFHMLGWPPAFRVQPQPFLGKDSKWLEPHLDHSCYWKHCLTACRVCRLVKEWTKIKLTPQSKHPLLDPDHFWAKKPTKPIHLWWDPKTIHMRGLTTSPRMQLCFGASADVFI